jgi:hypothetical protein
VSGRRWWHYAIVTAAAIFLWLGIQARVPQIAMDRAWLLVLVLVLVGSLLFYWRLRPRRQTGFS